MEAKIKRIYFVKMYLKCTELTISTFSCTFAHYEHYRNAHACPLLSIKYVLLIHLLHLKGINYIYI